MIAHRDACAGATLCSTRSERKTTSRPAIGSMSCCYFADGPVHNMGDAMGSDREKFGKYFHGMLEEGIYLAPSQFEAIVAKPVPLGPPSPP